MSHRPKLIGLTGAGDSVETVELAKSLAASFSEGSKEKVLFVDMNAGAAAEHSIFQAEQALYLSRDVVRTQPSTETKSVTPTKLYELLPMFRASDFGYVIFNLPPIHSTSPTFAMAGFMDKVLMIVDGDKSDRQVVKGGYDQLVKLKADVSCVFGHRKMADWIEKRF